ncbi:MULTISPECIES: ArsA family ATPase [unclassified Candidatus Frackibacter]|uniref:ArsA family ATPase n=1 Tax=unclassified Candidatus Frackibacter TaxID=2648818 RepID=UPI00087FAA73|nr:MULTISPECIES: ArsA family ATPase [unclassified Candidatus Frackibacter]SDC00563.1 arsenite-transporting ATPase [Candidatus Frackibacter sp. WG11]SEM32006.1 arsenite-transporting ATPase [Candidatus Frackibacter sp. WG12]SFL36903.1 arsenite-transporting ATPase [Candidatus Frackibacter sp. WG13]
MTLEDTKYIFFSGKGGVGKTSMASTTAVYYADQGLDTILVTTDPAANLSDVFEQEIGHQVTEIEGIDNLSAMEIDSKEATEEYKEKTLAPMRDIFNEEMLEVVEEQLNSPCTEEMASFDRFIDFMDDDQYDVVIFDTAPTGHTIRLLELPVDWSKHIEESAEGSGQTCMGPVQTIQDSKEKYDRAIELLKDEERTEFIFVMQPEGSSIRETARSSSELSEIGIATSSIIVNGILPEEECKNPFFKKRGEMQQKYLAEIDEKFDLPAKKMELLDQEIKGIEVLRKVANMLYKEAA